MCSTHLEGTAPICHQPVPTNPTTVPSPHGPPPNSRAPLRQQPVPLLLPRLRQPKQTPADFQNTSFSTTNPTKKTLRPAVDPPAENPPTSPTATDDRRPTTTMATPQPQRPPNNQRELVFCHQCQDEWYRDESGIICPSCQSDFTEIVSFYTRSRQGVER